jgi:hypothetical protein
VAEEVVKQYPSADRFPLLVNMGRALAHYVNRETIIFGTPEAKLAARLLDFDDSVEPLLGKRAEEFYIELHREWAWNSRYWEQRALLRLEHDPMTAYAFATTAVGIERHHPVPLTTLAKVCFRLAYSHGGSDIGVRYLREGLGHINEAMTISAKRRRKDVHVYDVGIRGVLDYYKPLAARGMISIPPEIRKATDEHLLEAAKLFRQNEQVSLRDRWDEIKLKSI